MNFQDMLMGLLEHSFLASEVSLGFSAMDLEKYRKMKEHSPSPNRSKINTTSLTAVPALFLAFYD